MSGTVSSIVDYVPEPDAEAAGRRRNMLWILTALSLGLAFLGYVIIIYLIY